MSTEQTEAASVAAFAPDLMDQSKVRSAIPDVFLIRSVQGLSACDADIVLVDLSRAGVLEAVGDIQGRVIGFGSHVDEQLLADAELAGCDEVLARSVFFRRLSNGTVTRL